MEATVQRTAGRFAAVDRVRFGASSDDRAFRVQVGLMVGGIVLAATQLWAPYVMGYSLGFVAVLIYVLLRLDEDHSHLLLNFAHGTYTWDSGKKGEPILRSQPLSEIDSIVLRRVKVPNNSLRADADQWAYQAAVHFTHGGEARIGSARCSTTEGVDGAEGQVRLCLELAEKLWVPVIDESGWQGWRNPKIPPERIVVPPGQPHPVDLLPPPKTW